MRKFLKTYLAARLRPTLQWIKNTALQLPLLLMAIQGIHHATHDRGWFVEMPIFVVCLLMFEIGSDRSAAVRSILGKKLALFERTIEARMAELSKAEKA